MINKPTPFEGLNIRTPIIIPTEGRGLFIRGLWCTLHLFDLIGSLGLKTSYPTTTSESGNSCWPR